MAGEIISARMQTTARRRILGKFVSAELFTDSGQFAPKEKLFNVRLLREFGWGSFYFGYAALD